MILVFSAEPTKATKVSDRATHALFEWIKVKEIQNGSLVFPDSLFGLNHKGLEMTTKFCKSLKLLTNIQTINYPNGDKYVGEVLNGKRHGQGTMTYLSNGETDFGEWK